MNGLNVFFFPKSALIPIILLMVCNSNLTYIWFLDGSKVHTSKEEINSVTKLAKKTSLKSLQIPTKVQFTDNSNETRT